MNAAKRNTRELTADDYAELQTAAERAIRNFVRGGMPEAQREDCIQEAIARAIEDEPAGTIEELGALVSRYAADIAGNDTRREKRHQAIRQRDPSLTAASGGTLLEGDALRQAVKDRAWRELRQLCPDLDRETLDRVLAEGSELEGTPEADYREFDAWELHLNLARTVSDAAGFLESVRERPPAGPQPQIDRLAKVMEDLCGLIRITDIICEPTGGDIGEIRRDPNGTIRPSCERDVVQHLLTYHPRTDHDMPWPGVIGQGRKQACQRWLVASLRGDVPFLPTNKAFAYVTLLAGEWPRSKRPRWTRSSPPKSIPSKRSASGTI